MGKAKKVKSKVGKLKKIKHAAPSATEKVRVEKALEKIKDATSKAPTAAQVKAVEADIVKEISKPVNSTKDLTASHEYVPAEWKERAVGLGLVWQPATAGSPFMVCVPRRDKPATSEQRVFMAEYIQKMKDVGHYVKVERKSGNITSIGDVDMAKAKEAIPGTGLSIKDVEKLHAQSVGDAAEREKQQKKEAARKAKEEEEKRQKEAKARKKMKGADLTPKSSASAPGGPLDVKRFKGKAKGGKPDADPKAQVKGISSPPAKKKAGMEPSKVPSGGFTKDSKPATSGELIRSRIFEHKLTDDQIAAEVRKLWPGRSTAVSDVRWNRSQMEKAGIKNVPEPVEGSTVPGKRK